MTSSLSATEHAIAELWQEALQVAQLPSEDDDFFSLGGDSLSMVMVEFRIAEELAVQVPPGATLGASTLRDLAALVDATRAESRSDNSELPAAGS